MPLTPALTVLIAPNPFKGSLSAPEAAHQMAAGMAEAFPEAQFRLVPLADGGEGTVDCFLASLGGQRVTRRVRGPLGDEVDAAYALLPDGSAVVEIAAASGLPLVPPSRRDPMRTTSFGTGQLIRDALDRGARRFILGLGGSATVDGGIGLAMALGARFVDLGGWDLSPDGRGLLQVDRLDMSGWDTRLRESTFTVASDVDNPLLGPQGAAAVFGPQKGAGPEQVALLDAGLARWAGAVRAALGVDVSSRPGAGAAGGVGAAAMALFQATVRPGVELVMEAARFGEYLRQADLVLTGEGRMDSQTAYGKGPLGVARRCRAANVPLVAFAGSVAGREEDFREMGFDLVVPVVPGPQTVEEAMALAGENVRNAARRLGWALALGKLVLAKPGERTGEGK